MTPEVENVLRARLREWAKYRKYVANDPGIGYPRVNTLKRIAKPNSGDSVAVVPIRDWTPEQQVDESMAFLQAWHSPAKHAVEVDVFMARDRLSHKVEAWNLECVRTDPRWQAKRERAFRQYRAQGLAFLAGRLTHTPQLEGGTV